LLSSFLTTAAQEERANFAFYKIPPPEGNFFQHITGITQDKSGYMWFSSKKGLYRYDGYEMINYKNDQHDPHSIPSDALEAISIDKEGNIWLATLGAGILKFDPTQARFTQYRHSDTDTNSIGANWVSAILADKDGNIWIGTGNGLDRFNTQTGKFYRYRSAKDDPRSLSANPVFSIYQDRQGTIWVGTGTIYGPDKNDPWVGGLNRMDDISGKFTRYVHDPNDSTTLINNKVRAIYESSDGTFWIGTSGDGLHTMDRKTGKFVRHTFDPKNPEKLSRPATTGDPYTMITFIAEDRKHGIWIGTTDNGLSYYDPVSKSMTRFGAGGEKEEDYFQSDAWTAYCSSEGVMWISSFMGSLYRVNPLKLNIPFYLADAGEINGFYEDEDGTLWISSVQGGLAQLDVNKKFLKRYVHDPANANSLANDSIFDIIGDSYGNIWMGTMGSGVEQYVKSEKKFIHHAHQAGNNQSLSNDHVVCVYEDKKKSIWIGTFRGLNLLDRNRNTFRQYIIYPEDSTAFGRNIVSSIIQDKQNRYWVGSFDGGGLHSLNISDGKFQNYLKDVSITRIFEDSQNRIWAAALEGLFYYDVYNDRFVRFTDPVGLTELNDIKSIIEDNSGNLWLNTTNTIVKINQQRDEVASFGHHYGIRYDMPYGISYKARSGDLYFSAESGYYSINPESFNKESLPPIIAISNFRLSNKDLLANKDGWRKTSIVNTDYIKLNHDQNVFSFDFAAIDFVDPKANRIFYMLENYDKTWNAADFERRAIYFNVPTGNYKFRVRATNAYGKWAERIIEMEIVPAWWNRWWFRLSALLTAIAIVYLVMRWRIQEKFRIQVERADREKKLSELQNRTSQLEMHALRAQMNPHFLFNSLNSINRFIIQNNTDQASAYLTKFSRLMRLILQNSQNERVPLENELEALKLYLELEAVRFDHHFTYSVKIDDHLDVSVVKVPPLIVQPYAENAIWHGLMHKDEKGHLLIEILKEDDFLIFRITDDGIGRQKAAELKSKSASSHKSMGMKITADRISNMKQKHPNQNYIQIKDLVLDDGTPAGTSVEIKISLHYD
jgi:ligand-binding sensor domain-containing protein